MRVICLLFTLFATSAIAEQSAEMKYKEATQKIAKQIRKHMSKHDIVGMSVALVDGQEVVWAQGFGYADKQNKVKATPQTVYRVGSITKLFNAVAAMQMVEQGKMQLNAPLHDYLPEFAMTSRFAKTAADVTVKNILTHHSGIISDWPKGMWSQSPQPFTQLIDQLANTPLAFEPGQLFSYSNAAVTLLGHGVQNIAGQSYIDYVSDTILKPLDMHSSYLSYNIKTGGDNARGYVDKKAIATPGLRDIPAGGLNSNVLDLAKFTQMMMANGQYNQKNILQVETVNAMLRPQNKSNLYDAGSLVGLGWMLAAVSDDEKANAVAWHSGGTFTFFSDLRIAVKQQLAVVVLSNSEGAMPVVNQVSKDLLEAAIKIKTNADVSTAKKIRYKRVSLTAQDLQNMPGTYSTIAGVATITRKKNKLKVRFGKHKLNLIKKSDDNFYLQYKLFGLIPISLGQLSEIAIQREQINGKEIVWGQLGSDKFLLANKIQPHALPQAWLSRLGDYKLINPDPDDTHKIYAAKLYEKDGLLLVDTDAGIDVLPKSRQTGTEVLHVLDDNKAYVAGLGRGKGGVLHVLQQGEQERISIYGYQFERQ